MQISKQALEEKSIQTIKSISELDLVLGRREKIGWRRINKIDSMTQGW